MVSARAPTTIWSNRSRPPSSWPESAPCCAGRFNARIWCPAWCRSAICESMRSTVLRSAVCPIELTPTEFTILEVLMRAVGRIVSRDELAGVLYQAADHTVRTIARCARESLAAEAGGRGLDRHPNRSRSGLHLRDRCLDPALSDGADRDRRARHAADLAGGVHGDVSRDVGTGECASHSPISGAPDRGRDRHVAATGTGRGGGIHRAARSVARRHALPHRCRGSRSDYG